MDDMKTEYDCLGSCNKCGGDCDVTVKDLIGGCVCEAETKCKNKNCAHSDNWAYGRYESCQIGLNASRKYYN